MRKWENRKSEGEKVRRSDDRGQRAEFGSGNAEVGKQKIRR
ncbi:hypothetical protein D1AOALGA4SA_6760 [Olavius algarvensis Delta 1 endosymbiont]|nr:hypothetical protein D1AOALGA4SA_6760 [Olavius algarvensis Delta 1 endosymbiont]